MADGWQLAWVPTLAPSFARLVSVHLQPVPILPAVAVVLAVGYLCAAARLWRLHRPWPVGRTASFLSGCLLLAAVSGTATEGYGLRMFSVFMFQQLTLMIAIPPFLVLGSPFRLALRSVPHHGLPGQALRVAVAITFSRPYRLMLHPGFAIPAFLLTYYGLYLTSAGSVLLSSWWGHNLLELGFLLIGTLFAVPIFSSGPGPIHPTYLSRMFDVFAEMALHAFFGVLIMLTPFILVTAFSSPPEAWGVDPLADQEIAGGLAWSYGEGPAMVTVIYLVRRWFRDDTSRAEADDQRAVEGGDVDLQAYNARLAQLAGDARSRGSRRLQAESESGSRDAPER